MVGKRVNDGRLARGYLEHLLCGRGNKCTKYLGGVKIQEAVLLLR